MIAAAASEMAKPPAISLSADGSARNVAVETTTCPLDALIDAILGSPLDAPILKNISRRVGDHKPADDLVEHRLVGQER